MHLKPLRASSLRPKIRRPSQRKHNRSRNKGGDRKSEEVQGTGRTLKIRGGTATYRTAKIARDRPDILTHMKAGKPPQFFRAHTGISTNAGYPKDVPHHSCPGRSRLSPPGTFFLVSLLRELAQDTLHIEGAYCPHGVLPGSLMTKPTYARLFIALLRHS
jgi:hypothetical protein